MTAEATSPEATCKYCPQKKLILQCQGMLLPPKEGVCL